MKSLSKLLTSLVFLLVFAIWPTHHVIAQDPVTEAIKLAVKKVIKAIDLQVQRFQNNTIDLQNIQKKIENELSKLRLNEIGEWTRKQKEQYQLYFDELWRVKSFIAYYHRLTAIAALQKQIVQEYGVAYREIRNDGQFTDKEKEYIYSVYSGMVDASVGSVDDIIAMMRSFTIQMSDAERLALINETTDKLETLLSDLRTFNKHNRQLSDQRAASKRDLKKIGELYGF